MKLAIFSIHVLSTVTLLFISYESARAGSQSPALISRAATEFGALTQCESRLLSAVVAGETAQCSTPKSGLTENTPPTSASRNQTVLRAKFLRWLIETKSIQLYVDPKGVRIEGSSIEGPLDLTFVSIGYPIYIQHSTLREGLDLTGSRIQELDLEGSHIGNVVAENAQVQGSFSLEKTMVDGRADLINTTIGGDFVLSDAFIHGSDSISLYADRLKVSGNALLRKGFSAHETLRLRSAQISGSLDLSNCVITASNHLAISADGAQLLGGLYLRGAKVTGEVNFVAATVNNNIELDGGRFSNPTGDALAFQNVHVSGNLYHRDGALSEGWVNLRSADVKGELQLLNPNNEWQLDLSYAKSGPLIDDPRSWPKQGNLNLNGFVYSELHPGSDNAAARLGWLGRQTPGQFRPQPYQQLARILKDEGDDSGATDVLIAMENSRLRNADLKRGERAWLWLQGTTIGYGYSPGRAVWFVAFLTICGAILFSVGYRKGAIIPVDEKELHQGRPFNGFVYSLENLIPFVTLGHSSHWIPNPDGPKLGRLLRYYLWIHILLGWFFASMLVASVSGLVHK